MSIAHEHYYYNTKQVISKTFIECYYHIINVNLNWVDIDINNDPICKYRVGIWEYLYSHVLQLLN